MRSLVLVPLLLVASPALAQSNVYRAAGNGPNWTLAVGSGSIIYREGGRARVITPSPAARNGFSGERLVTPRITIDISHAPCSLRGDGARFRDTVRVTTSGGTVVGCGGGLLSGAVAPRTVRVVTRRTYHGTPAPVPQGSGAYGIDRSSWTIIAVDDEPVRTARATSIRFHDGRVDGNAGCNAFGGSYTVRRGVLTASRITSTRMACGSGSDVERAVFATLENGAELDEQSRDRLVLNGRDHSITLGRVNDPEAAYRDDRGYDPDDDRTTLPNGYQRGRQGNGDQADDDQRYQDDGRYQDDDRRDHRNDDDRRNEDDDKDR